jgi:4-amino-4-deoxy-L-arabinose transferase-like glycosyltransferase
MKPNAANSSAGVPRLSADRVLWVVLLASTVLKLGLAIVLHGQPPVLDEAAYLQIARQLAETGVFEGTFRPPLYPAFLALFLSTGLGTFGVRVAQCLLSAISVALVYRLTDRNFGRTAARIAAIIFAFDPVLVTFSHHLWSETLFIFLVLVMLDRLSAGAENNRLVDWLIAGVALGLAGLTRPMILTFAPLLLPWAILQARRTNGSRGTWGALAVRFAVLTAATCAAVLPWTARNYRLSGAFILVDTNGAFNFLVGTQPDAAFVDKDDLWSERFGRVENQRYEELVLREPARAQDLAMTAAKANIAEHSGLFVRKSFWEATHLWTLDSFLLRHLRNGWYGGPARRLGLPMIAPLSALFFIVLVLAGFLGLAAARPAPLRGLSLLLIVHSTLLFGLTYALSRYALPLHAVLAIFAGYALSNLRSTWQNFRTSPHRRRRELALILAVLGLTFAWVRDLPLFSDMIAHGGAAHRFRYERVQEPSDAAKNNAPVPGAP